MSDSLSSENQNLDVSEEAVTNQIPSSQIGESLNHSLALSSDIVDPEDDSYSIVSSIEPESPQKSAYTASRSRKTPSIPSPHNKDRMQKILAQKDKVNSTSYEDFINPKPKKANFHSNRLSISSKKSSREEQKREQEEAELKKCTFAPSVNSPSTEIRSTEQYYKDVLKHQQKRQERIQKYKSVLNSQAEHFSFKPKICKKSEELLYIRSYMNYVPHQRLHKDYRKKSQHELPKNAVFVPSINKRSKMIARTRPADFVYSKKADPTERGILKANPKVKISKISKKVLVEKFKKEFEDCCQAHNLGERVNYMLFTMVLTSLLFLAEPTSEALQLWKLLARNDEVDLLDLQNALLWIMGLERPGNFHWKFTELHRNRARATMSVNGLNKRDTKQKVLTVPGLNKGGAHEESKRIAEFEGQLGRSEMDEEPSRAQNSGVLD